MCDCCSSSKRVVGISGSPIPNSNTDRALKAVLAATGCETEFIKLTDYTVAPCKACLGCVKTNRCVIEDDGIALAERVKDADAIVIGCYTPYSSIDARTKAFIERLYPLRHNKGYMRGKTGAVVVTSAIPEGHPMLPPAADMGANAVMFYMMEEGMNFAGTVKILGNVPCLRCGSGDECEMTAVKMMFGPEASVDSVAVNSFEESATVMEAARELGHQIGHAVREQLG